MRTKRNALLAASTLFALLLLAWAEEKKNGVVYDAPQAKAKPAEIDCAPVVDGTFGVALRTPHIGQFPCASCHDGGQKAQVKMHVDIQLAHAGETVMDCDTCHTEDRSHLKLNNGSKISFNHAYQLCSQCHFEQARDWRGGAHGKRLSNWDQQRVVENCTGCHNPHKPAFEQRLPHSSPKIPRKAK